MVSGDVPFQSRNYGTAVLRLVPSNYRQITRNE
jgi:hypothetical protein